MHWLRGLGGDQEIVEQAFGLVEPVLKHQREGLLQ
jgi:hypothetical protein